jgi:hypothetical protein
MLLLIFLYFLSDLNVQYEPFSCGMTALADELVELDKIGPDLCATDATPVKIRSHVHLACDQRSLFTLRTY